MPLASICTSLALLVGVQPCASWAGNPDVSAQELVAWVNEAQQRVADEADWQALLRDGFADLSGDAAGVEWAFDLPADCRRLVPDSLWLQGLNRRVHGPLTVEEWEWRRHAVAPGIAAVWTLAGGQLLLRTYNSAGTGVQLVTNNGLILLSDGVVSGNLLTMRYVADVPDLVADGQASALGAAAMGVRTMERVILLCAVALYRDAKGLPAGAAGQQYQTALALAKARDKPMGVMHLGRRPHELRDGVGVVIGAGSGAAGPAADVLTDDFGSPLTDDVGTPISVG